MQMKYLFLAFFCSLRSDRVARPAIVISADDGL